MDGKVLIAYASKYGATAEIAGRIGQGLREAGLSIDVLPAIRVRDLTPYRAVVLGSAVYMFQWRKEAAGFLKANEKALVKLPVWLFSSGPLGGSDAVGFLAGATFPKALQHFADRIHPQDIAIFHGAMDLEKLNSVEKYMVKNWKSPLGDFRDWEIIDAWAHSISDKLLRETS
ncbi:MAG: hypothetical protein EHM70_02855 [Chloroflexota bacterium]|nr:MAG: hypothetical protein EHM70_02855 [Chloroflexota bacterium]